MMLVAISGAKLTLSTFGRDTNKIAYLAVTVHTGLRPSLKHKSRRLDTTAYGMVHHSARLM